jgi:hypothetical protein
VFLNSGDGKCKDFVQEIESGKKDQHDDGGNSGPVRAFFICVCIGAQGTGFDPVKNDTACMSHNKIYENPPEWPSPRRVSRWAVQQGHLGIPQSCSAPGYSNVCQTVQQDVVRYIALQVSHSRVTVSWSTS